MLKLFCLILLSAASIQCFASLIDEMTLEEKVGQLLMVHFKGETRNQEAKILIQKLHVGSIIYYNWANGLKSPFQVRKLSKDLQKLAHETRSCIPLLIAVDQEGGAVARLKEGFTVFPGNKALGMTQEPKLAKRCAFAMGQELQAVGINLNLSPVVDINSNPANPCIGIRAFGDSPSVVTEFARNALEGYRLAGILTALKHFPGHGDVKIDSHEDLPEIKKSWQELEQNELRPFIELASQSDAIITAHLLVKALDPIHCTTLSKKSLDFIRNEIGFKGVIISDSLVMEGLLKNCTSIDEAAILALNAGCDILMLGGKQLMGANKDFEVTLADCTRIHQSLVLAVQQGRIEKSRLDEAVRRILELKNRSFSFQPNLVTMPLQCSVKTDEHASLASEIAKRSLQIQQKAALPLLDKRSSLIALIAPEMARDSIQQTSFLQLGGKIEGLFFDGLNPTDRDLKAAEKLTESADLTIFFTYNAYKNARQIALIKRLLKSHQPFILIVLCNPLDADLFSFVPLIITTFSPTAPSIQAASDFLSLALFGS